MLLSFVKLFPFVVQADVSPFLEEQLLQEQKQNLRKQILNKFSHVRGQLRTQQQEEEAEIKRLEEQLARLRALNATTAAQQALNDRNDLCLKSADLSSRWLIASPTDRLKYDDQRRTVPPTPEECHQLREVLTPRYACPQTERMGNKGDGGYAVCLRSGALRSPSTACVSYSFGLGTDWSYDVDLSGMCYTHSFDPTLYKKPRDVQRFEGRQIDFHKWGLTSDGRTFCHRGATQVWSKTLEGTMSALNHTSVDILKLSIDEGEWEFLEKQGMGSSVLHNVTQLVMKLHFHHILASVAVRRLSVLRSLGFSLFQTSFRPTQGTEKFPCGNIEAQVGYIRDS
eukprot:NODE_873_length_1264_cov_347.451029_g668_i0.p1 GENE.NODE_873_length_1264_cov_347.451029_g668_i0~~NODE_873_length_1264_cov_347.451029_g668_i0.p1  ORF type:complete len:398 (-),score=107.30 NODE_873_length_1264_cov_347.451029_g668_i0:70-1089(-)